jgi:hypothetical protein
MRPGGLLQRQAPDRTKTLFAWLDHCEGLPSMVNTQTAHAMRAPFGLAGKKRFR